MRTALVAITGRRMPDLVEEGAFWGGRLAYMDAIVESGGIPVIIPRLSSSSAVNELLSHCDGVLLPGGEDISPSLYGEAPHPLLGKTDPERDDLELAVITLARAHKIPLLGICRGHQIVNVAFGGSLYQDIDAERKAEPKHTGGDWTELVNDLDLEPDSLLASTLGTTRISVNSLHHQAVKRVGVGLRVTGRSSDGLVEAMEGTDSAHWLVTVQCHPERLFRSSDTRWAAVFGAFVDEASRRCAERS